MIHFNCLLNRCVVYLQWCIIRAHNIICIGIPPLYSGARQTTAGYCLTRQAILCLNKYIRVYYYSDVRVYYKIYKIYVHIKAYYMDSAGYEILASYHVYIITFADSLQSCIVCVHIYIIYNILLWYLPTYL